MTHKSDQSAQLQHLQLMFPESKLERFSWGDFDSPKRLNRMTKKSYTYAFKEAESAHNGLIAKLAQDKQPSRSIVIGHSLGGKIVANALAEIGATGSFKVGHAVLLGAAVQSCGDEFWEAAANGCHGAIYNICNFQDDILGGLFSTRHLEKAVGQVGIKSKNTQIEDIQLCSELTIDELKSAARVGRDNILSKITSGKGMKDRLLQLGGAAVDRGLQIYENRNTHASMLYLEALSRVVAD